MTSCLFACDLHGGRARYLKLMKAIENKRPEGVFLGGDLLPSGFGLPEVGESEQDEFLEDFLVPGLVDLRRRMGSRYPKIFAIMGNDDPRSEEPDLRLMEEAGLWTIIDQGRGTVDGYAVYGYPFVPPTPFMLKDWERYDVSRFVDPGCVSPEEGRRSVPVPVSESRYSTIRGDLSALAGEDDMERAVFLFHSPPYGGVLDRAALDGKIIDHVPLDVHVGSIAIRRFIEERQPLVTLHGHVHESTRITGKWSERIGRTVCIGGAHDGPELSLVSLDLECPQRATRALI